MSDDPAHLLRLYKNGANVDLVFEDLGVTYVGPVPGHDLVALDRTLRKLIVSGGCLLLALLQPERSLFDQLVGVARLTLF